jgi:histone H3/H4
MPKHKYSANLHRKITNQQYYSAPRGAKPPYVRTTDRRKQHFALRTTPFSRAVRKKLTTNSDINAVQRDAVVVLQEVVEEKMVHLLAVANLIALSSKRVTLLERDVRQAARVIKPRHEFLTNRYRGGRHPTKYIWNGQVRIMDNEYMGKYKEFKGTNREERWFRNTQIQPPGRTDYNHNASQTAFASGLSAAQMRAALRQSRV